MKQYIVYFKGYRRDCNKNTLPHYSGIYMVYRCVYTSKAPEPLLKEIIYIGQAVDLNDRLNNHEKYSDFLKQCSNGEELCFAYANVSLVDLDIVENALIFAQKPRMNKDLVNTFNHKSAKFLIEGQCLLLKYRKFSIK